MNYRILLLAATFLLGYAANDLTQALGLKLSAPVQAYSNAFAQDVLEIVNYHCEVIIYDGEAGEISC